MLHALQVPQTYAIVAQLSVCLPNAVISCMTCCPAKLIFITGRRASKLCTW